MSVNFTLCGSLFENLNLSTLFKKKSYNDKIKIIIEDINILLNNNKNSKEYICNHILNKIVQITKSEYGFIGRVIK